MCSPARSSPPTRGRASRCCACSSWSSPSFGSIRWSPPRSSAAPGRATSGSADREQARSSNVDRGRQPALQRAMEVAMVDTVGGAGKAGPVLQDEVQEVQGRFPNDATLQDALSQLTLAGYDRADFSLPEEQPAGSPTTPNEGQ